MKIAAKETELNQFCIQDFLRLLRLCGQTYLRIPCFLQKGWGQWEKLRFDRAWNKKRFSVLLFCLLWSNAFQKEWLKGLLLLNANVGTVCYYAIALQLFYSSSRVAGLRKMNRALFTSPWWILLLAFNMMFPFLFTETCERQFLIVLIKACIYWRIHRSINPIQRCSKMLI